MCKDGVTFYPSYHCHTKIYLYSLSNEVNIYKTGLQFYAQPQNLMIFTLAATMTCYLKISRCGYLGHTKTWNFEPWVNGLYNPGDAGTVFKHFHGCKHENYRNWKDLELQSKVQQPKLVDYLFTRVTKLLAVFGIINSTDLKKQ